MQVHEAPRFGTPRSRFGSSITCAIPRTRFSGEARGGQCLAISKDGLHWTKPKLGLVERDGSKDNNIVAEQLYQVIFDASGGSERLQRVFRFIGAKARYFRRRSALGGCWKFR